MDTNNKFKILIITGLMVAAPALSQATPCAPIETTLKEHAESASSRGGEISGQERRSSVGGNDTVETTIERVALKRLTAEETKALLDEAPCPLTQPHQP